MAPPIEILVHLDTVEKFLIETNIVNELQAKKIAATARVLERILAAGYLDEHLIFDAKVALAMRCTPEETN